MAIANHGYTRSELETSCFVPGFGSVLVSRVQRAFHPSLCMHTHTFLLSGFKQAALFNSTQGAVQQHEEGERDLAPQLGRAITKSIWSWCPVEKDGRA